MANAVKFVPKLKELRIHLCSRSESSKGVREFIQKSYVGLKKANPKFPILIRECSGVQPKLWARYELGKEVSRDISNKPADQILSEITTLNK
ncbi:NADH dehydrogenase [ubiquinone] 1 alpha subcomplex subunit 2 [Halyomorpha halys]|uniref:NADH dehydrogenase [ubiquinone] 1 alpha subcomplex subunit 2 n=1 Tax=Halyomorpha halys TaxID=286706 RepID=UPI0006D4E723|nr:NADH dehydrogenase [ubiquinone] 1 alpha subcomplex subunit 2 [Halyomorpha halys]